MLRDDDKKINSIHITSYKCKPIVEMFHSFLRHDSEHSCSTRSSLACPVVTNEESIIKHSLFSKILNHHHVFPTAYCMSHNHTHTPIAYDENETERDLQLPGIRVKSRYGAHTNKTIGEFEINQLLATESGWDRVKYMYRMRSGKFEDEGTLILNTMFYRTVLVGFFVSAMMESVRQDKAEKSFSLSDAIKPKGYRSQVLLPKTVLKAALKDTLKLSFLSLSLLHLSQTISAYKNKTSVWEFTLSSAIGFGAIGLTHGPAKFGLFTVGGAIFGTLSGWLACQVLQSSELTQESRNMKRMQQRVEELRSQVEIERWPMDSK